MQLRGGKQSVGRPEKLNTLTGDLRQNTARNGKGERQKKRRKRKGRALLSSKYVPAVRGGKNRCVGLTARS